ncbi:MAG: TRAP transporter small permease [Alcaligenaceae bacterium]|nr:TRAP transporter small permease [Alcaligenaceae bacterium]
MDNILAKSDVFMGEHEMTRKRAEKKSIAQLNVLAKIIWSVATVFLLLSTSIMIVEGLSRFFFNVSYFWAEELVRFLMVWAFFLTLGIAGFRFYHIRTELLVQRLSAGMQKVTWLLAGVAGMVFAGILFYSSIFQVMRLHKMGMVSESNLEIPLWIVSLALFMYYFMVAVYAWKRVDPFVSDEPEEGIDENVLNAVSKGAQL